MIFFFSWWDQPPLSRFVLVFYAPLFQCYSAFFRKFCFHFFPKIFKRKVRRDYSRLCRISEEQAKIQRVYSYVIRIKKKPGLKHINEKIGIIFLSGLWYNSSLHKSI